MASIIDLHPCDEPAYTLCIAGTSAGEGGFQYDAVPDCNSDLLRADLTAGVCVYDPYSFRGGLVLDLGYIVHV